MKTMLYTTLFFSRQNSVAEVKVTEGQTIEAYQSLVVVEAMEVYVTTEALFAGNLATEELVDLLHGLGIETGIKVETIVASRFIRTTLAH